MGFKDCLMNTINLETDYLSDSLGLSIVQAESLKDFIKNLKN